MKQQRSTRAAKTSQTQSSTSHSAAQQARPHYTGQDPVPNKEKQKQPSGSTASCLQVQPKKALASRQSPKLRTLSQNQVRKHQAQAYQQPASHKTRNVSEAPFKRGIALPIVDFAQVLRNHKQAPPIIESATGYPISTPAVHGPSKEKAERSSKMIKSNGAPPLKSSLQRAPHPKRDLTAKQCALLDIQLQPENSLGALHASHQPSISSEREMVSGRQSFTPVIDKPASGKEIGDKRSNSRRYATGPHSGSSRPNRVSQMSHEASTSSQRRTELVNQSVTHPGTSAHLKRNAAHVKVRISSLVTEPQTAQVSARQCGQGQKGTQSHQRLHEGSTNGPSKDDTHGASFPSQQQNGKKTVTTHQVHSNEDPTTQTIVRMTVRPLEISMSQSSQNAEPLRRKPPMRPQLPPCAQKGRNIKRQQMAHARYDSACPSTFAVLPETSSLSLTTTPTLASSEKAKALLVPKPGNPSVCLASRTENPKSKAKATGLAESVAQPPDAVQPKRQESRKARQISPSVLDKSQSVSRLSHTRQYKRSEILFAKAEFVEGGRFSKQDSAVSLKLDTSGSQTPSMRRNTAAQSQARRVQKEYLQGGKPREAQSRDGDGINNNQFELKIKSEEMQAITPRALQKPPLKPLEESKLGREQPSLKKPKEAFSATEGVDFCDKVIDSKLIYQRKFGHSKTSSMEQSALCKPPGLVARIQAPQRCPPAAAIQNRKHSQQRLGLTHDSLSQSTQLGQETPIGSVPTTAQGDERLQGKTQVLSKQIERSQQQMSRAFRVKEESKQHSLALKKATAEAALMGNYGVTKGAAGGGDFSLNHRQNHPSNRSQVLTSFTVDAGISTGTLNATEISEQQANQSVQGTATSQAQLNRLGKGMLGIALPSMNISQVIQSPRPPPHQPVSQYSLSSVEISGAPLGVVGADGRAGFQQNSKTVESSASSACQNNMSNEVQVGFNLNGQEPANTSLERQDKKFEKRQHSSTLNTSKLLQETPERLESDATVRCRIDQSTEKTRTGVASAITSQSKSKTEKQEAASVETQASAKKQSQGGGQVPGLEARSALGGRKHVTDDFFLHQSKNAIQLRRVIDCEMKRRVQANPRLIYQATPKISAHYWAIFDGHKQSFIHGKREYMKREVASLTKIMTVYTVIELARQYKIKLNTTKITVCGVGSNIRGTTAKLKKGDILTVEELLYGTMLPSGNDAAFVLAKYFGRLIFEKRGYDEKDTQRIRSYQFNYHPYFVKYFLKQMNDNAVALKLMNSFFDSPHGLMNPQNISTAYDMARLSAICMQIPLFRRIVATKTYTCRAVRAVSRPAAQQLPSRPPRHQAQPNALSAVANSASAGSSSYDQEESSEQSSSPDEKPLETVLVPNEWDYHWVNTNRLLGIDGFSGVKTGITEAAGACLSSCFEKDGNFIVVVILQSKTMDARWEEAQLLIDWAVQRRQLMAPLPPQSFGYPSSTMGGFGSAARGLPFKAHN